MVSTGLSPAEKVRLTLDLFDSGVDIMRQNLRRRHPTDTPGEIEARLETWLRTRPAARRTSSMPGTLQPSRLLQNWRRRAAFCR